MTTTTLVSNAAEAVAKAEQLAPRIRELRQEARRDRHVPDETWQAIRDSGLARLLAPKAYGGLEADLPTFSRVCRVFGRADGSTGWVYCVLAGHSMGIAMLPRQAQDEIWLADPDAAACGAFFPIATAEAVDGGALITGRLPFASGSDYAQYAWAGCMQEGLGVVAYLIPIDQVEFLDDWDVLGLEATQSRSLNLEKLFVPEHMRLVLSPDALAKGLLYDNPTYLAPPDIIHATLTSVLVGVAEAAMDEFVEATRGASRQFKPLGTSEAVQIAFAESTAEVHAAGLILDNVFTVLQDRLNAGLAPDPVVHQGFRRDGVFAARLAVRAVDRLHAQLGGRAIYSKHPLGASFRDMHAGLAHAFHSFELGSLPYAQLRLGVAP